MIDRLRDMEQPPMEQSPAAQILDAVAFVRATAEGDLEAIDRLLTHADPREMLLAISSLLVSDVPNLSEVLDHWHQGALREVAQGDGYGST